jgi:hypothetical protein
MPNRVLPVLFLLAATVISASCSAQSSDSTSKKVSYRRNELAVSEGILSIDEFKGIGGEGSVQSFLSFPTSMTGCLFISYKHAVARNVWVGLSAGIDHQDGTMGIPPHSNYGNEGTVIGVYSRRAVTYAIECKYIVRITGKGEMYVLTGMGATSLKEHFSVDSNVYHSGGFSWVQPANPFNRNIIHYNAQGSWGVRYSAGNAAFFAELGIGYKGLFSCGVTARL